MIENLITHMMQLNSLAQVNTYEGIVSSMFIELISFFLLNTLVLLTIVKFIYAKSSNSKDYYFSFIAIGITVFLLSYLLENVKLELGFALGLFAIFGIIRYRTDAIPIREMTYLFVIIGISVINALAGSNLGFTELILINTLIIAGIWGLEKTLQFKTEKKLEVVYEKIQNIHLKNREELIEDLRQRTGLIVNRLDINHIDFLKDVAHITLYYQNDMNKEIQEFEAINIKQLEYVLSENES